MKPPASLTALATELKSLNAGPAHQYRVLRAWLRGHPLDHGPRKQAAENFLPLALRTALPQLQAALEQAGFHDIEIHKNEKDWLCMLARK